MIRHQTRRTVACRLLLAVLAAGLLAGCQVQQAHQQARMSRLERVYDAYRQADYSTAYQLAVPLTGSNDERLRTQAAYMAGMSALQLGDTRQAARYLAQAAQSRDETLRRDADVNLGLVLAQRGQYDRAAHHLLRAAPLLSGQDRANAYFHAGASQQKLGRWAEARTSLSLALSSTNDAGFREQVREQLRVTGYTIQTAAFADRDNATRAAGALADDARRLGLGSPRMATRTDPQGRRLVAVQVGTFSTFSSAAAARSALGASHAVIVPIAQ